MAEKKATTKKATETKATAAKKETVKKAAAPKAAKATLAVNAENAGFKSGTGSSREGTLCEGDC